jgi:hypothetical protein
MRKLKYASLLALLFISVCATAQKSQQKFKFGIIQKHNVVEEYHQT